MTVAQNVQHDDPQQRELLRVARIGRAQGLKGEVTVQTFTDEPEQRFAPGSTLFSKDGAKRFTVERSRTFRDRWIIKLEGVDDRNAAEDLNGTELYCQAVDLGDMIDDDVWYLKDLVGLDAQMDPDNALGLPPGLHIGKVVEVIEGPQWLLKIRLAKPMRDADGVVTETTALVPFVEELVPHIDPAAGYLTLDPPGGLIPGL